MTTKATKQEVCKEKYKLKKKKELKQKRICSASKLFSNKSYSTH